MEYIIGLWILIAVPVLVVAVSRIPYMWKRKSPTEEILVEAIKGYRAAAKARGDRYH